MKKSVVSILIVIALLGGGAAGYFLGKQSSVDSARKEVKSVLDVAFPPPPKEMKSASGKIKAVQGSSIELEVDDPEDYLPHTDGTARKKLTLKVEASAAEVTLIDYSKFDKSGNPEARKISFSDLRIGDVVTVRSDQNIRTVKSIKALKIELVRY